MAKLTACRQNMTQRGASRPRGTPLPRIGHAIAYEPTSKKQLAIKKQTEAHFVRDAEKILLNKPCSGTNVAQKSCAIAYAQRLASQQRFHTSDRQMIYSHLMI